MEYFSSIHEHKLKYVKNITFSCNHSCNCIFIEDDCYNCSKCNYSICKTCFLENKKKIRYEFRYQGPRRNFKKALFKLNINEPTALCYFTEKKKTIFSFCTNSYLNTKTFQSLRKIYNLKIIKKKKPMKKVNSQFLSTRRNRKPDGFYTEVSEYDEF